MANVNERTKRKEQKDILEKRSKTVHFLARSSCAPLYVGWELLPLCLQLVEVPERSLVSVTAELFIVKQAVMLLVAWRKEKLGCHV